MASCMNWVDITKGYAARVGVLIHILTFGLVDQLNVENLVLQARFLRSRRAGEVDADYLTFGLTDFILRTLVGNEWTNQVLYKQHPRVSAANRNDRQFFRAERPNTEDAYRNQERARITAENVFNLQKITGIQRVIDEIKTSDLESYFTELQSASQLKRSNVSFRFNTPSGEKGKDFDILIEEGKNGIACEIKTKVEETELSHESVLNSLKDARGQLPKDKPGLIFVRLPEEWIKDPNISKEIDRALRRFYGQTQRILAVVFRWEQYRFGHSGGAFTYYHYRVERNRACSFSSETYLKVLESIEDPPETTGWTSLRSVATFA